MSILSDRSIFRAIDDGSIVISPFDAESLGTNSYDVRLARRLVTHIMHETHRCIPFLEGKSSGGRLGLSIHATAGKGDVGFCGHWTMEITVAVPLRVYARMPIGQLIYHEASSDPLVSYTQKPSQKYAGGGRSDDPTPVASRMSLNFTGGAL